MSILWKKQLRTIAAGLEKMDSSDLFDNTCRQIEKGYHVKFYTQRGLSTVILVSTAMNSTTLLFY